MRLLPRRDPSDDPVTARDGVAADVPVASPPGPAASTAAAADLALARQLCEGDRDAFAALYDRYAATVHGLTRAILRDEQLAEEATHDVFLQLWQRPTAYEAARGTFAGWLLRVARNRAIDLLRRRREQPFAATSTVDEAETDVAAWVLDPDPDPADQVVSHLTRQDVRDALARLTEDQRHLLELAYFGGLSHSEIAARLARPLGTVKTQLRAAMQRLAALMIEVDPTLARPQILPLPPPATMAVEDTHSPRQGRGARS